MSMLLCFLSIKSDAQQHWKSSSYALVYKITDEQALELARLSHNRIIGESSMARTFSPTNLVDTIYFNTELDGLKISTQYQQYELGTYVAVRATGEYLEYKLLGFYDIGIVPVWQDKEFHFHIVDSSGHFVKADEVRLNDKPVKYNSKKQRYEHSKFKDNRLLVVKHNGRFAFFEVDANHNYYDNYRNNNWFAAQWNKIQYSYLWRSPFYAVSRFWNRQVQSFKETWIPKTYGYITTNKPKYLPNDTLQVKAYLTRDSKIPYNCPLTLRIWDYGGYKFERNIEPDSKGNYSFTFPLGDSLQLDRTYFISIYKNNRQLTQTTFLYEDYQLDEITYELRADKQSFKRQEPIIFYAQGKDKNGQHVMDAEVEITAQVSNIRQFYAPSVTVPDTLFYYKGDLNLGSEMRFPLEKSSIPLADFSVNVLAVFTNSNGELHRKTLNFDIVSDTATLEMSLEGDLLIVDYLINNVSTPTLAKLEFNLEASDFIIEKTVQLPYKAVINPIFNKIVATAEDEVEIINLRYNQYGTNLINKPDFELIQTMDSVFVIGNNPNGLLVSYEIYKINHRIAKGESSEKIILWKDKINKKTSYRIDYEYIVNGEGKKDSKKFDRASNQLTIDIEQPTTIQPGETVDVKVKVRKNNSSNARNVNLAAGAVNTQFENTAVWKYNVPFYGRTSEEQQIPSLNENAKYNVGSYHGFNWIGNISDRFQQDLQLDKILYYQLLFPQNGIYKTSRTIQRDDLTAAEFVPFIVKDGHFQPIYMLYVNRKLSYYHDTESTYSFAGHAGYNQVIIRGKNFELHVDSLQLTDGTQVIFAIDLNNLPKHTKLVSKPDYYTEGEKSLLRKSIFTLRQTDYSDIYVWQDDVVYKSNARAGELNFGPFYPDKNIHLLRKNHFETEFLFEPGYKYEVQERRERLYHTNNFPADTELQLRYLNARVDLGQQVLLNKNIAVFDKVQEAPLINRQVQAAFKAVTFNQFGGKINYQINNQDSSLVAYVFVNQTTKASKYYYGSAVHFRHLSVGKHTFYGFTKWGNYFEHEVEVRKDTMLYEHLSMLTYHKDADLTLLKSLVALKEIVIPNNIIGQNDRISPTDNINYSGQTYSISGQVTDEEGVPIISATVQIKGTTIGTVTDLDGNYVIQIPEEIQNPVLIISYIGFSSKLVELGNQQAVNVTLDEGAQLDEVVVVGYGEAERTEVTRQLSLESVKRMPTRSRAKLNVIAGVQAESKSNEAYYIDGIEVADTAMFNNLQSSSKIRSRFSDYAFWQPNLITDRQGEANFRVTYPDDITAYQTFVIGMDKKHNFGIATKIVNSQKVALAQLSTPRFLIAGDKANIIGKSLNYSNDSLRITSSFLSGNDILESSEFWLKDIKVEATSITAAMSIDTMQVTYKMEHAKFFDGERRPIPIYKKGVQETVGTFNILNADTTITLKFDSDKGNVKLYAQTDILEVLLEDVQYLIDYPYGCNEQTASRLLALLMDKQIKTALGEDLPKNELIMKMVKRLEKAQNDDGSWGWWSGNTANYWMTNYVLKALHAADTSGYKSSSFELGLRFVTNSLEEIPNYELLNTIELLSDIKQNLDYGKYLLRIDSVIVDTDYYNQFRLIKIKQQQGLAYDLAILDALEQQTLFGNVFYDVDHSKQSYYYWYANHFNLTNVAYQILRYENIKQHGEYDKKLAAIRGYFLENRSRQGWRNTFTTAQILSTILPDMSGISNRERPQLIIKGEGNQTVNNFPFETTLNSNQPVTITKTGSSTVYLTGYQQFWNEKPKAKNDIFELTSTLFQDGEPVKKLQAKNPAKMVVTVAVKKEAEYIMIEVPIPAGCSYGDKNNGFGRWYGREVHREYFREKTCVYYESLPVGTYTIEINLEPRFTGEYTINPAKAEQMYFPTFYGRNTMKAVKISE